MEPPDPLESLHCLKEALATLQHLSLFVESSEAVAIEETCTRLVRHIHKLDESLVQIDLGTSDGSVHEDAPPPVHGQII